MTPHKCRVRHDPPNSWGDCLRVSVASMLDINPPEKVPHFFDNGVNDEDGMKLFTEFLASQNLAPYWTYFDPSIPLPDLLEHMQAANRNHYYMLFCRMQNDGNHVVICCGNKVVHDSAWMESAVVGPVAGHNWIICTFVPLKLVKDR